MLLRPAINEMPKALPKKEPVLKAWPKARPCCLRPIAAEARRKAREHGGTHQNKSIEMNGDAAAHFRLAHRMGMGNSLLSIEIQGAACCAILPQQNNGRAWGGRQMTTPTHIEMRCFAFDLPGSVGWENGGRKRAR